jgi:isoamylase
MSHTISNRVLQGAMPAGVKIKPGMPSPLGATWDGKGVNFAIFSKHASGVHLCLFDDPAGKETMVISIEEVTHHVWHVYVPGLSPGQLYGYRVLGAYDPLRGLRFNQH